MNMLNKDALHAVLRQDLRAFIEKSFSEISGGEEFRPNWHIDVIVGKLMRVYTGETRRLIINIPPRKLKSTMISVAFIAWVLGHYPGAKIIAASYGEDLVTKFSRETKMIMQSSWYQATFPETKLSPVKNTEFEFHTTQNGMRFATTVNGGLTGIGGDYIIIDDPIKVSDASSAYQREKTNKWFSETVLSRLNNKSTGVVIVTMQRTHVDDLSGYLLEQGGWDLLSIPAISQQDTTYNCGDGYEAIYEAGMVLDPESEPREILEELRQAMGHKAFSSQYLQDPLPDGGGLFNWKHIQFFDPTDPPKFEFVMQSWDVASSISPTANFSVCTTWGIRGGHYFLLDVKRVRLEHPALLQHAKEMFIRHKPDMVLVEASGIGAALYQSLRDLFGMRIWHTMPKDDKLVRAEWQTPLFESGRVHFPPEALWLNDFRKEFIAFPGGKYDDQVDSMVNFLNHVENLMLKTRFFRA